MSNFWGAYHAGTVCASVKILPHQKKSVRFVLSWSIPYCHNYWFPLKDNCGKDVKWKNYYAVKFENSLKSAEYALKNWNELFNKTLQFKNSLYSTTMDKSFKQAIGSALSVLKSPTVSRLEDGSLYGFDGSNADSGSCEGLYFFAKKSEKEVEICEDIRCTRGNYDLYKKRKETIERLFGTAKEYHGFRYTQMVGKAKMEMKVGLTFACPNLKKLAKILDRRRGYTDFLRGLFDVLLSFLYFNPQKEKSRFSIA